ncbi:MAG TPA: fused MFS/spermidine synthase, partial [Myxococcota bacterium]|nr:fused MFS/spermidine synthase [Myxococcota bacterium]
GALVGAALCGFSWIPTLGLAATNNLAVGLDASLGLGALVFGLWMPPEEVAARDATAAQGLPLWREGGAYLVVLLSVTGAAAMALQVLWTRALGTALGPSTYAFTAIVCAYLGGLAIGSLVAARIADRIATVRLALMLVLLITAVSTLMGIAWVDDLPSLLHPIVLDRTLTMEGLVRSEFLLAALSVLPATVGMGAIFPLTVSAVVGSEARLGAAVGRAYAVNTVGSIFGSFAGVFILLPLFGVEGGMRVAALCYVGAALYLSFRLEPSVQGIVRAVSSGLAVAAAIAILVWPRWDVARWTAGIYRLSMTRAYFPDAEFTPSRLVFHRDGLASTVTVEEDEGVRWIKVNGKIDGSSEGDMPTQVLSGLLPMMVHPKPREVAVIGCGSCVTVGAALQGNPNHVTLIELEREVVNAAALFSEVNHAPWGDPRVSVVEDDGRNFMMRPGSAFD